MRVHMKSNDRIYVAGDTGMVGSAAIRKLRECGYNNLLTRSHSELDLTDCAAVERFFQEQRPDYVILAAGKVGGILENRDLPADFISQNLSIQLNVIMAAHRAEVRKLILFASSCMYPRECSQPISEEALFTGLPEQTSMAYAVSKMAGLQLCLALNHQYGKKRYIPVIPNSIFGPYDNFDPQSSHVLSALIRRFYEAKESGTATVTLWGSGQPRREFIYVDDVVNACLELLFGDIENLELPVNIGSGADLSIAELAEKIAALAGYEGSIVWDTGKPDGSPRKLLDSNRIRRFGWEPSMDFDQALADTFSWFSENQKKEGTCLS